MKFQLPNGTVNYESFGRGTPLLALHGGPGDLQATRGLLEPVFSNRTGWRRVYFDLPGCGKTVADDAVASYDQVLDFVLAFMDGLLPGERVALAGLSYGGYLARGILHHRPDQITGLCLIVPRIMQDRARKTVPEHQVLVQEPGFMERLPEDEAWLADYMVVQTVAGLEKLRQHYLPGIALYDEGRSDRMNSISPGLSFDVDDLQEPFQGPALIVTGRQDQLTGYQDGWRLTEIYPRASYVVLDQAGHFLGMGEQEKVFRVLVEEWADRVESALAG